MPRRRKYRTEEERLAAQVAELRFGFNTRYRPEALMKYTTGSKRQVYLAYLYGKQNGSCAICRTELPPEKLCIDHDHGSGLIRGLLCSSCNSGLGFFRDDPVRVTRAASYLRVTRSTLLKLVSEATSPEEASRPRQGRPSPENPSL